MEADRALRNLEIIPELEYGHMASHLDQIERRLQDELLLRKIFVLDPNREKWFDSATSMFGDDFAKKFQSAAYDVDEAGKCFSLERTTAAVFHLMRTLETAIKAVSKCLQIPDPIKDAERNWGKMLKKLNVEIEIRAKTNWATCTDALFFADAYASLDAVRNVWRNATMHVEVKYTLDEAEHIFHAVRGFMKKIASRMNEQGLPLA